MRIVWIILVVLLGVGFTACSSAKRVEIAQKSLPSWYENPPRSSGSELYAVGEGRSKKEAINNALSLLASTLSVSISSTFNAKTVVKEGRVNSSDATYINQTQSEVKKIRITNYELLNAEQMGFKRFAVLIGANKKSLFRGLKDALDQQFMLIYSQEKAVKNENPLRQLAFYHNSLESLKDMQNRLSVMKVLNKSFDTTSYVSKRNHLQQEYNLLLNKITFFVNAEPSSQRFIPALTSGITKQKFQISKRRDAYHFSVFLNAKIVKVRAYGFSIARMEISFTTKDYKNRVIATNLIHIDGQSSQGYSVALQDLVKKLNAEIEKEGIFKILNLNIY
ncbi:LPP20 family lipoprotein [Sulfurimonas sp.]|uniref:LPP20 family lipoprotein n=1 Tax=Sulfurimonas sp. TaxID=2022749 RepID=UPI002631B0F6|nr:LPP20 family lipoprotein [Sulfurimonas sp.]